MNINQNPWQDAIEGQMEALRITEYLIKSDRPDISELNSGWQVDRQLVQSATPFVWNEETMQAVMLAGQSIPLDTELRWNLNTPVVWWYFEKQLPYPTVFDPSLGIRALCFGWLPVKEEDEGRVVPSLQHPHHKFGMPCVCWIDDKHEPRKFFIQPSQTWEWGKEATLGEMLRVTRIIHETLYEKGGRYEGQPHVQVEQYMEATENCARFILAALAWLQQKILITSDGHLERHARKRYARTMPRPVDAVRIINLRRREYTRDDTPFESEAHRTLSCRFQVDGFWRNQAYGPKMGERRLTWINPYMKGPADAPFRVSPKKVYRVDR